ncbi:hypothetical protein C8N46_10658 [Kordia periserrulae]|uniref:Uncharacterized protein n=1 Tax=Kordia periserrulae TaxID=701523 RepID=A0A2T6BWF1_9FLAO|nr:DUF6427 family protein [Kordia periserrulae]PTX60414.1 hypothetical protein C8N46_10658 [Kordia periserrulae]
MITSVFGKSKPINFILCAVLLLVYFVIYLFSGYKAVGLEFLTAELPVVLLLLFSLFMVNFVVKKNDLTEQNDYALFVFTLVIGFFPSIFQHINIVLMQLLILFALRRIISLGSLRSVKQKLFDASFFIGLAVLFDAWMVLYMAIVYLGILLYVSSDYKNWLVPFIGFGVVVMLYSIYVYLTKQALPTNSLLEFDVQINYSTTNYRRIALHFVIAFLFSIIFVLFLLKYKSYSSQKKLSFLIIKMLFFIGTFYVLLAKNSIQNSEFLFAFPLAVFMANLLENIENKRIANSILFILMIVSFLFNIYLKEA